MRQAVKSIILMLIILTTVNIYSQSTEWYVNKPIAEIRFTGLKNIDKSELEGITGQYIGKEFSDTLFWDLQSKLYALNYFENFSANAVKDGQKEDKVIIEFNVTERPLVGSIEIRGNKNISTNQLLDVTTLKQDDILNNAKIRMDREAIRQKYIEAGYPDVEVESSTEESEDDGYVDLFFSIAEGNQTRIKIISFSGNSFASENTLKQQLSSKQQSLFSKGVFQESLIEQDKAAIEKYYMDSGFINFKITDVTITPVEEEKDDDRNYIQLTYYLEEGKQWTFGGYLFEGNTLFSDQELLQRTTLKPGSNINMSRVEADFMSISDKYYDDGYIYNSISREEVRNEEDLEISYKIVIEEKSRAHIENIIIKGNEKTKDHVILREIPLGVGDVFSKSAIMQGLNNLYNTRYFSSVVPEMPYGSELGLMDLVINVEEQNTTDIQFGLTFTASAGAIPIIGFLKWNDSNFLGEGKTINAGVELAPAKQELNLGYNDNWLLGRRLSVGFDFSFSHNLFSSVPQDILFPIFFDNDEDNPAVVPDPYDGHWVDASTGVAYDGIPTADEISDGTYVTDYDYAVSKEGTISPEYLMDYESYQFTLSGNGGYTFITPHGRIGLGAGLSTALSYAFYDPSIYRPFDKDIRDSLNNWNFTNKIWLTASWDTRDLIYSPTEGFILKETLTYTGGLLFGNRHYIKTTTNAETFFQLFDFPVFEDWNFSTVLGLHTQFSMVLPQFGYINNEWSVNTVATREDLLYFDGMFLARGWSTNYDNRVLWDTSIDLTTPLAPGLISWNTFLSGTAVWDKPEDLSGISINDFYFSLGTGAQIDIPSFPISFFFVKRGKFTADVFSLERGNYFNNDNENSGLDFVITFNLDYF